MKTVCLLDADDIRGKTVRVEGRSMLVDDYGYSLWQKHKWKVTYSNFFPHRYEGRKVIPFCKELLQLHGTREVVRFWNGDKFDCRLANLRTRTLTKHYA